MMNRLTMSMLMALALGAGAAEYSNLKDRFCDAQNRVIYDGAGRFSLEAQAATQLELTLDLAALESYLASNDYKQGPMVTWEMSMPGGRKLVYGLADTAKHLTCFWDGQPWEKDGVVSYETLKTLAQQGRVTLSLSINPAQGIEVRCGDKTLLKAPNLKTQLPFDTTHAYAVNTNYVTSVGIKAASSLDTSGYQAPTDYTQPFTRTQEKSLGRVMFCGDSITHGVNDQTWRWQLFKTLVDNAVEAQIVGPRSGYTPGYTRLSTSDAGDSYAGVPFPNVHLAQSSGRTHNIISGSNTGMSGVNYGGHSTRTAAAAFNCDTWCCLMGTNDLLSDRGYSPQQFVQKMQNLLGGKVSQSAGRYAWKPGREWGNMGRIAADVLKEDSDVLYVMAVPCWGHHSNNNEPERHEAVRQYNRLLKEWVARYSRAHDKKLRYVEVNEGMVDYDHPVPFSWPDSMSNRPGRDGLHPNEQGSLIIAGNLARAMGLPGRTAGLPRAASDSWQNIIRDRKLKTPQSLQLNPLFDRAKGYSIELKFAIKGQRKHSRNGSGAVVLTVSDTHGSGTLRITPTSICWGDRTLYCARSFSEEPRPLRLVWHPGAPSLNQPQGYYLWLGDMLIGQGLPAGAPAGQGISLEASELRLFAPIWFRCTAGSFSPAESS